MHVYVQKSTTTTLPRKASGVSGCELSQVIAPAREGRVPSTGSGCARMVMVCMGRSCASDSIGAAIEAASMAAAKSRWDFMTSSLKRGRRELSRSEAIDIDDRLRECLRRFLRQIVPDTARDGPMRILARELLGIGAWVQVRRAIGIAFHRNGGHGNDQALGQLLFEIVVSGLALR